MMSEHASLSDRQLRKLLGAGAIAAPVIHTLTDVAEWIDGGFSATHLWTNYVAFLLLPFLMLGLYLVQRPKIGLLGLAGSVLYGASFVYFAHTSLYALSENVPDYATLWEQLGNVYTVHGVVMVVGGLAFGLATYRARVFPRWTPIVFLAGIALNALLALAAAPDMLQTLASALRNLGLIGMGFYVIRTSASMARGT